MEEPPAAAATEASINQYPARTRRIAAALMLAAWLAFNFPALAGEVRFPTDYEGPKPAEARGEPASNLLDLDTYFAVYPWRHFLGASLRGGHLPLWDPSRFAGAPFAANISTGTFYPPNWAYTFGDVLRMHTLLSILSQLIALLGAYWLFRLLRMHPYAAALGAVTFAFSGFMTGWAAHDPVVNAVIWLPLALAGAELARKGRTALGIVVAGLALTLSVLAGHVQFSIYVWMAFGLWMAVAIGSDLWRERGSGGRAALGIIRRGAGVAAAPFVMAAGLASVQILGVAEFSQHIFRRTENYATVLGTALPYRHLPTLLIPDYFGNPVDSNYAGPGINYTQLVLYMGLGTLVLAAVGLLVRRDRIAAFFGILGLIGVLAALGTPFYKVLYVLVPGLSRTTHIARFIFFIHFALTGLAVLGLDTLLLRRGKIRVAYWAVPAVLAALGVVVLGVTRVGTVLPGEYLDPRWVRGLLFALGFAALMVAVRRLPHRSEFLAGCLVALIAADLWAFGFRYHPFQAPRDLYEVTPEIAELKSLEGPRPRFAQIGASTLPFNAAQVHGLYGLNGYDPFLPDTFVDVLTIAEDQRQHNQNNLVLPFKPETAGSPILDLFGVEAFLHPKEGPGVVRGPFKGPFTVERNPDALPAAFLARCWEVVPAGRVVERLAAMSTSELGSIAVLEAGPGVPAPPDGEACPPALAAAVPHYSPEVVRIRTPQAGASLLVLTDQWFNGWEATVDGKPARIYKADHAFRAVALSEGSHEVVFRFRPKWVPTGLAISALTALLTAAAVLAGSLRKRRRELSRPE